MTGRGKTIRSGLGLGVGIRGGMLMKELLRLAHRGIVEAGLIAVVVRGTVSRLRRQECPRPLPFALVCLHSSAS